MANMADTTILSWISAEVDQALEMVRRNIVKFLTVREDPGLLKVCPEHLHQVSGALRMVGLAGATRFCETLERSLVVPEGGAGPSAGAIEVIDRSVLALKEFVNELARGQANVPLRLFPAYQDLVRLQGGQEACEKELFFPDLTATPPGHPGARTLPEPELAAFLQTQRVSFERGLLAWLRDPATGLEEMRGALDALHEVAAQLPEPRGLWWASVALIDALPQPPDADWLKCAKAICNKIDFHIRDLAAGRAEGGEPLAREVLYAVAKAGPLTERIKEVRQLYQLDGLFPATGTAAGVVELDIQFLEVALYDLHSRLDALKGAWVRYVSGEKKSAGQFRDLVASFKAKAAELGNQHLIKLLDAVALVAARLPDPYPRQHQYMVIEMASAFLLIEHVVDHFTAPAPDLDRQIVLMGGWLLDAEAGKAAVEPPAGLRPELTQQIGALQLRAQVAKEIMSNLQQVEQVLDAFARDPGKRETLPGLETQLRQIHGALMVLGFDRAAQALKLCERMIGACAQPNHPLAAHDMDWIAEGLSSIGLYLTPCLHGHPPGEQALALFFDRLDKARASAETAPADITVTLPPATPAAEEPKAAADAELLGIFLEEANEVLAGIRAAMPPDGHEALTTIRRGFHTLKGSGRMVGLMDLGEAAWVVEQVLNGWLEDKRPATPGLVELIETAAQSFAGWIAALSAGDLKGEIDASPIAEAAQRLKEEGEAPPKSDVFEIYAKEATEHAAVLDAQLAAWAPASEASEEFMRAAHTLASSSRTAGFGEIADLASAVEQWVPFAPQTQQADAGVLRKAVDRLTAMVGAVVRREADVSGDAANAGLRDLTKRLSQPRPVVIDLPRPAEKRVIRDDIDAQLLPIFLEEAQELVPTIGSDLRDWKAAPRDALVAQSLQRALHTLKGSARMAGAIRLGELTHLMESAIEAALEAEEYPEALFQELEEKMDRLSADVERLRAPATVQPAPQAAEAEAAPALPAAMLRVNADTLDQLINESGEVAIARSRMEAELRAVKQTLSDLGEGVARLRGQLREVEVQADSQLQSRLSVVEEKAREYDPLEFDRYTRLQELTRLMAESLNDVMAIQQTLIKNAGETEAALLQQARISRGVQQELMRMRAVPFSNLNERLYRVVRQVSRELDKRAELEIEGADVELDRSVLERIAAPLEHILRNAVVHGLESPAGRAAAGKPEFGRIGVTLRQEANEIALVIADDGAGLDLARLREKGLEMGLLPSGQEASEAEVMQLIFVSGLSTADAVTEIAGRGVGMDVVRNEIAGIGGRIDIASRRGQGTTFTLYLPLTLAVTQAVLVRSGPSVLAVASAMVEQVLRLKSDAIAALYAKGEVEAQERVYPLHYLQHLLGDRAATAVQPYNSVLLLRSGIQRVALHVDELIGNQEIVVKYIGAQLARIPGVSGATVLADGTIALIVNPVQLAGRARAGMTTTTLQATVPVAGGDTGRRVIMVVDDSLTVRKVTSRLLEREGYRVVTAKDGVDALEALKDQLPDVMLVDIEMPRMDGFELTRSVRGDPRSAAIPIIVITSRTAGKHRAQAAQLGVNAFLGKPYQEGELLQELEKVLA
jgi:chemosensory pili system protein ChpA (sensor histidine kinase/response regulator)